MIGNTFEKVREKTPLVHCITNYVTVNDCANALLAVGGSPIMSDEIEDVRDITKICTALNINIGTLNKNTISAMFEAGKIANDQGMPVLLDPVGAGASKLRTETAKELINAIKFSVIRGNISEIKALATGTKSTQGVDASDLDAITNENVDSVIAFSKDFSKVTGAVIVITGATDLITDGKKTYLVKNGHSMMSKITGTGCMLSTITSGFIGADKYNIANACLDAVCTMGLCGERAFARLDECDGNAAYRNMLIDDLYNITPQILKEGAKYEIR